MGWETDFVLPEAYTTWVFLFKNKLDIQANVCLKQEDSNKSQNFKKHEKL